MKQLKKKIFFVLFFTLTISTLSFIIIFQVQKYIEQVKIVTDNLNVTNEMEQEKIHSYQNEQENKKEKDKKDDLNAKEPTEIKFMDRKIYTILLDQDNQIQDIINMTNQDFDQESILRQTNKILQSSTSSYHVGCLYLENYAYVYQQGKYIIILDNSSIRKSFILSFIISLLLFFILEVVIYFIVKMLTNWIIQPVICSFEKQKQFIADASHELKTPLSVIIASSEALYRAPDEKKWLQNIQSEANRMDVLIHNLLELTASEQHDFYHLKPNNLSKIVELSVLTFEGKAFEKSLQLQYEIEDDISFSCDENAIKQLVEILLDNAICHASSKSTIYISLQVIHHDIQFIVKNEGDEIPKGEEEKIFDRFYRVDKARNRKENRYGLGLAIAKNIVTYHHGVIQASSSSGITSFIVTFKK